MVVLIQNFQAQAARYKTVPFDRAIMIGALRYTIFEPHSIREYLP
jgi:hypothetical protein